MSVKAPAYCNNVSDIFGNSAAAAKLLQVCSARSAAYLRTKATRPPKANVLMHSCLAQEAKERQKAEYTAGIKAQLAEKEALRQAERSQKVGLNILPRSSSMSMSCSHNL